MTARKRGARQLAESFYLIAKERVHAECAWRERNVISLEALVGDWGQAQSRFRAEQ